MERILFLVTSGNIGGAQRRVLLSAQKSKRDDFEVFVGGGSRGWLSEELKKKEIPFLVFKNLKRSFNPFSALLFALELRKFLKKEKIDVINFNSSNTLFGVLGLIGLKKKPKTIFTVHGWTYLSPGFKKSRIIKNIVWLSMKVLLPFVDEIIFVCNYDKELAKNFGLIRENQARIIYNKINEIDFLSKEEALRELKKRKDFPDNKIIVGTITRLEYAKNNEFLIEGFSKLSQDILEKTICLIIGNGPEENNLKFKIKNLKLEDKVFLLGDIPEAAKYLKAFDIFVITSRYEGLPYALLEAMAAELPIIATHVGGTPEILEGKGILIEPDNINDLTTNLSCLIKELLT
jgi:glycosyltransferase involved in cell wall biosynthesis